MTDNAPKKRPADTLRDGGLSLTIWPQVTRDGFPYHTAVLDRTYKVDQGFGKTSTLRTDDLLKAAQLLQDGYKRIKELDRAAQTNNSAPRSSASSAPKPDDNM